MKQLFTKIAAIAAAGLFSIAGIADAQAEDGLTYGYCSDEINGVGFDVDAPYWIAAAFQLSEEDVERFDGAEISTVSIGFGSGRNKEVTVFMTYDLKEEPFYTQAGRVKVQSWCPIPTTSPVKIEKGKPIWIGYRYNVTNSGAYPVGTDSQTSSPSPNACWMSAAEDEAGLANGWTDKGAELGNASIRIVISGANVSTSSVLPKGLALPSLAYPGQEFSFTLSFSNASSEEVKSIEGVYRIGEDPEQPFSHTFSTPIPGNGEGEVTLTGKTDADGFSIPVTATITKVNGEANEMASRSVSGSLTCTNAFFERKVLSEKYTGSLCGWCPLGIVGFEYMWKKYSDRFVPVAVQNYSPSEPAYCAPYEKFYEKVGTGGGGAPSCWVNRDHSLTHSPEKNALETSFLKAYTPASNIGIKASFTKGTGNSLDVTATVQVARDVTGANYAVTFILTEDHVGPYLQSNNYNSAVGCPEWSGIGTRVPTIYDHVARNIVDDGLGIPDSLPADLKAGEEYSYTHKGFSTASVSDLDYCNVIAVIVDTKTREVLNCDLVHVNPEVNPSPIPTADPGDPSGIDTSVVADGKVYSGQGFIGYAAEAGEAVVYTLSGTEVARVAAGDETSLPAGIYLVRTLAGAVKTVVK